MSLSRPVACVGTHICVYRVNEAIAIDRATNTPNTPKQSPTALQEDSYKEIIKELDALPSSLPRPVFEILLKKIYKRSK